nr:phosphatidylglycerol lysyltransferase domain-containing protein [Treponemataceae bacterium]
KYDTQIAIKNDILFRYYEGNKSRTGYGFPLSLNPEKYDYLGDAIREIIDDARNNKRKVKFCLCTQAQKILLDSIIDIDWKTNRDDCDYIYLTNNLANLEGNDYHKKKNHLTHFMNAYGKSWLYKNVQEDQEWEDILNLADSWLEEKDQDDSLVDENIAIHKAVENHRKLNLKAGIIYIENEAAAMTIASPCSDSVMDILYEKALEEYAAEGAYTAINYYFARNHQEFMYINREEDLGIEGLRKSKLSYRPEILLDKFYGEKC